jgi:septal ring factor EnvC (AmiA/AmiB activator)
MFLTLMAGLWKPAAIALLIAAVLGYRALLLHQRDAARAEAAHLSASLADAEASNASLQSAIATQNSAVAQLRAQLGAAVMRLAASGARALESARIDAGCAAAIRWGNAQAVELSRW